MKRSLLTALMLFLLFLISCSNRTEIAPLQENDSDKVEGNSYKNSYENSRRAEFQASRETLDKPQPTPDPTPNLLAELLKNDKETTTSPLGQFDFRNFTYPLPRGWQDSDSKEAELRDGKRPILIPEEKHSKDKRIGLSYLTTKFLDIDSDGKDEAVVILQVETGGAAMPHLVYIFKEKDGEPDLIWYFRTGDRADGGLKNIYMENGLLAIELYGQDRYIIGEVETAKITGDEEQICCPEYYTKSLYKWDGRFFRLKGKRLTYSLKNENLPPVENMIEIIEKKNRERK